MARAGLNINVEPTYRFELSDKAKYLYGVAKQNKGYSGTLSKSQLWSLHDDLFFECAKSLVVIRVDDMIKVIFNCPRWNQDQNQYEIVEEVLSTDQDAFDYYKENIRKNAEGISMITLAMYHPRTSNLKISENGPLMLIPGSVRCLSCMMTIAPIITLILQIFFLILLTYSVVLSDVELIHKIKPWNVTTTKKDFFTCEMSSWSDEVSISRKIVASAIALLYTLRFLRHAIRVYGSLLQFDWARVTSQLGEKTIAMVPDEMTLPWGTTDRRLSYFLHMFTIILNLVIVMNSDSVLDMILDSLAIEFIGELDNIYREKYLDNDFAITHLTALCMMSGVSIANFAMPGKLNDTDKINRLYRCCHFKGLPVELFTPIVISLLMMVAAFICA